MRFQSAQKLLLRIASSAPQATSALFAKTASTCPAQSALPAPRTVFFAALWDARNARTDTNTYRPHAFLAAMLTAQAVLQMAPALPAWLLTASRITALAKSARVTSTSIQVRCSAKTCAF